jgi:hypothetical protein
MQYLGLSKQYGKKDSDVSQFLKKIFSDRRLYRRRKSAAALRSNFYPIFLMTSEFCDYLLEKYIDRDATFPLLVSSECTA